VYPTEKHTGRNLGSEKGGRTAREKENSKRKKNKRGKTKKSVSSVGLVPRESLRKWTGEDKIGWVAGGNIAAVEVNFILFERCQLQHWKGRGFLGSVFQKKGAGRVGRQEGKEKRC